MSPSNSWYYGSRLLEPLSDKIGLPIDQLNFLVCQLIALALGYPYRTYLGPHRSSVTTRHMIQIAVGLPLCYFCFGSQMIHYLVSSMLCYVLMMWLKPGLMEKAVFVVSMGYLAIMHIYRQIYDYGGYTLDITGPLMVSVQKLSSLGFSIRDGRVTDESKLSSVMKQKAVKEAPSLLEFLSYMFCFHGLMCGPFSFYKDYKAFIDGSNYMNIEPPNQSGSNNTNHTDKKEPPSPKGALIRVAFATATCAVIYTQVIPYFPIVYMREPGFMEMSIVGKMLFIMASTTLHRFKYYFAWKLGELVNANSGLGFNGYDKSGAAKWDLIDNADIITIETCTSLKVLLDKWNMTTSYWLRYVVYERLHSTLGVFALSAFWHGYYPGYYLTFIGGAFFIHTARLVRRTVRPWFQTSQALATFYDFLTGIATRMAIGYLVFPHVLLEFWQAIYVYRQIFFWMHIAAFLMFLVLKFAPLPRPRSKDAEPKKTQ